MYSNFLRSTSKATETYSRGTDFALKIKPNTSVEKYYV